MHRGVAAAAFLLVACERDLAVSSPSERPVIASFSPTTTFAFALVTVTGHGFDPTAANDVVRFGNVTARADSVAADGTSLEVFVPDGTSDVLDGPITVTTPNGTSAPSEQRFAFKGLGHLRHGTAVDTVRAAHPGVKLVLATVPDIRNLPEFAGPIAEGRISPKVADAFTAAIEKYNAPIRARSVRDPKVALIDLDMGVKIANLISREYAPVAGLRLDRTRAANQAGAGFPRRPRMQHPRSCRLATLSRRAE